MLIKKFEVDKTKYGLKNTNTKIYACLVQVDASDSIASVIREITDNSWISKLEIVDQVAYDARMQATIQHIMNDCMIFNNSKPTGQYDYSVVGEYIVSKEGRQALISQFGHRFIPLAELWKEKEIGNPGFDYHSESTTQIIIFGEAKYNATNNPYTTAINQVEKFITKKKDSKELSDLQKFVSKNAVTNFLQLNKGFSIAFSIKSDNPLAILDNAILSNKIVQITQYDEFYIIGVVINDK